MFMKIQNVYVRVYTSHRTLFMVPVIHFNASEQLCKAFLTCALKLI